MSVDDLQESWQAYFEDRLLESIDSNIEAWLDRFGTGLSAAAGHSVLRTYFSLHARNLISPELLASEQSICFADLTSRYCELSVLNGTTGKIDLDAYPALKVSSLNRGYRDCIVAMVLGY